MGFWKFIGDVLDTAIGPYPVKGSVVRSSDDRFYGIYDGYVIITTDSFGNLLRLREKDFALKFIMSDLSRPYILIAYSEGRNRYTVSQEGWMKLQSFVSFSDDRYHSNLHFFYDIIGNDTEKLAKCTWLAKYFD